MKIIKIKDLEEGDEIIWYGANDEFRYGVVKEIEEQEYNNYPYLVVRMDVQDAENYRKDLSICSGDFWKNSMLGYRFDVSYTGSIFLLSRKNETH